MSTEEFGKIFDSEVEEAVNFGEIIEDYPFDQPYHSVLIFGQTESGRPLHIVSAYDPEKDYAIIVTVYEPDVSRWIDYKIRRKR